MEVAGNTNISAGAMGGLLDRVKPIGGQAPLSTGSALSTLSGAATSPLTSAPTPTTPAPGATSSQPSAPEPGSAGPTAAPAAGEAPAAGQPPTAATQPVATQPAPEPFNAPPLKLPRDPSTSDVLTALAGSAGDPTTNESSAQKVYQLEQMLRDAHKSMIGSWVGG